MKHKKRWEDVYVSDDLSLEQQNERKELRCLAKIAKKKGLEAKVKGGKLEIGDKTMTYRDLYQLPIGVTMEAAKLVEIPGGTCFQSHHAYLSCSSVKLNMKASSGIAPISSIGTASQSQ